METEREAFKFIIDKIIPLINDRTVYFELNLDSKFPVDANSMQKVNTVLLYYKQQTQTSFTPIAFQKVLTDLSLIVHRDTTDPYIDPQYCFITPANEYTYILLKDYLDRKRSPRRN